MHLSENYVNEKMEEADMESNALDGNRNESMDFKEATFLGRHRRNNSCEAGAMGLCQEDRQKKAKQTAQPTPSRRVRRSSTKNSNDISTLSV